jgi:primosomal protein N'
MAKLRDKFRFQLQLQSADGELLRQVVRTVTRDLKPPDDVAWIADVDPIDMM